MDKSKKCACATCHCKVKKGHGVIRAEKLYCSTTCANECTRTTCLCVHDDCEQHESAGM